jgi:hypothetical protein
MPISDVQFDHVNVSAQTGLQIVHATGITFNDSHFTAARGGNVISYDAQTTGIEK